MGIDNVPAPGIHHNVPPETYHSWQALSHSWMGRLRQSPAHLLDLMDNGAERSSPNLNFGSAVHCLVLEPSEYPKRFAIRPDGEKGNTKAGLNFAAAARKQNMVVLSSIEGRWCEAVARRAAANSRLRDWLKRPHATEVSLVWERDGYMCKARADLLVDGIAIVADLKTTVTASPKGFASQVAKYHYHEQAAWYMDGLRRLTGRVWDFYFLACEKQRPFLVTAHQLVRDSSAWDVATTECERLFALYKQCCESRLWPGYEDVYEIELPTWAMTSDGAETEPDAAAEPFE